MTLLRRIVPCFNQLRGWSSVIKEFKDIPGPKQWPLVGNALLFSPFGPYKMDTLVDGFNDLRKKYGKVVRLRLGHEIVLMFDPNDIRTMYSVEGKLPQRPTFEALKMYRKEKFDCVGVVPDNGEEWYRLRKIILELLQLKTVHSYWNRQLKVAQDFSELIQDQCNSEGEISDFLQQAFLYALEAVGVFCYGRRLNCMSSNSEEGNKIAQANAEFLQALGKTFHGLPLWKLWKTKSYKILESTQNFMTEVAVKYINEARMKMAENPALFARRDPFLYALLTNADIKESELLVLVTEIYQGGIDATATTITMMLYQLARNVHIQNAIFQDLKETELKPGRVPPLLRACLKETLRLHPTATANSRVLNDDAVLSSYRVPKGTLVIGVNPVISRMNEYFENPKKFDPWRWLNKTSDIHPYAVLPFGHGARMCPGRRFAEQEIYLCISEIIKKYQVVSLNSSEISMVQKTNLVPNQPVDLGFISRN
nr:CYP363A1 protein [Diaphanosoma celebensis]